MIIAIPSTDNNVSSLIDDRFGRCEFFCFFNTEDGSVAFHENKFRNENGGVGPQVAEFLGNMNVSEVYSFEIGPKAMKVLDTLNISVKELGKVTNIDELINQLKSN